MLRFHKGYFIATALLFLVEVFIALYINDAFVRPYVGDFLVVMLVFYFFKSFFSWPDKPLAIGVFLFACVVEVLQYVQFLNWIGLEKSKLASVVLGTSFQWGDILAYFLGIIATLLIEHFLKLKEPQ